MLKFVLMNVVMLSVIRYNDTQYSKEKCSIWHKRRSEPRVAMLSVTFFIVMLNVVYAECRNANIKIGSN